MSLSALLSANLGDISTWTTETMDRVLAEGDSMFLKALEERSIPDEETIFLDYLPDRVLWSTRTHEKSPNEANNQNQRKITLFWFLSDVILSCFHFF